VAIGVTNVGIVEINEKYQTAGYRIQKGEEVIFQFGRSSIIVAFEKHGSISMTIFSISVLRIRPPPTDREEKDGVETCTEGDNNERGDDVHHATTARNDRQHSGYI
jgi:hypothetical protein